MESWLDNCQEPGRLPSILAAAGLRAGLESVAHKASTWPQTKLTPALQKQLLPGLKSCNNWSCAASSGASIVGVSRPRAFPTGCSRQLFLFFPAGIGAERGVAAQVLRKVAVHILLFVRKAA